MNNLNEQITKIRLMMGLSEGIGYDVIDVIDGIRLIKNVDRSIDNEDSYDIIDRSGNNIGFIHLIDKGDHFQIGNVNLKIKRTGLGYKIYKKLISILNKPLISDNILSSMAIGLWEKLVNGGLAEKFKDQFNNIKYKSIK